MSSENCFDKCDEWTELDSQLDRALDHEYSQIAVANQNYRELYALYSSTNTGKILQAGKELQEAQGEAQVTINELMMDRDEAGMLVRACDGSTCVAAAFCVSRLVTQEV